MNSKGVSEMVATVLLIAFVVAVGGIVSIWLTGFMSTTQESVEASSSNRTKCSGTYIDVISVTNDSIMIMNRGSRNIDNPVCYSSDGTNITTLSNPTLGPGQSNTTSWERFNNTSVICTGSCLNTGISGECRSTQNCWR